MWYGYVRENNVFTQKKKKKKTMHLLRTIFLVQTFEVLGSDILV